MQKVYYYTDEVHEDFAASNGKIARDTVDGSYRYSRRSLWWKLGVLLAYRLFATPVVWLYTRLWLGIRVKNRRALRGLDGCFVYLNHTQNVCDAFIPTIVSFPKRAYVITGPETVSIRGIRTLVALLGAIPLPTALSAYRNFDSKLKEAMDERAAVIVYPEAHIWPYCSFVRRFPDQSFAYPCRLNAPVVAGVTVYRQRRIFKNRHPHATVYLSDPIYPDTTLREKDARRKLCDEAYRFMSRTAEEHHSYAYVQYIKRD